MARTPPPPIWHSVRSTKPACTVCAHWTFSSIGRLDRSPLADRSFEPPRRGSGPHDAPPGRRRWRGPHHRRYGIRSARRSRPARSARTGHFPPSGGWIEALWQIGPLSRRVEDLVLMMRLLAGGDGADPTTADMAFAPLDEAGLHGLRVAFYT